MSVLKLLLIDNQEEATFRERNVLHHIMMVNGILISLLVEGLMMVEMVFYSMAFPLCVSAFSAFSVFSIASVVAISPIILLALAAPVGCVLLLFIDIAKSLFLKNEDALLQKKGNNVLRYLLMWNHMTSPLAILWVASLVFPIMASNLLLLAPIIAGSFFLFNVISDAISPCSSGEHFWKRSVYGWVGMIGLIPGLIISAIVDGIDAVKRCLVSPIANSAADCLEPHRDVAREVVREHTSESQPYPQQRIRAYSSPTDLMPIDSSFHLDRIEPTAKKKKPLKTGSDTFNNSQNGNGLILTQPLFRDRSSTENTENNEELDSRRLKSIDSGNKMSKQERLWKSREKPWSRTGVPSPFFSEKRHRNSSGESNSDNNSDRNRDSNSTPTYRAELMRPHPMLGA